MRIQILVAFLYACFLALTASGQQIKTEATGQDATSERTNDASSESSSAQTAAKPEAPQPLSTPPMTAPLQTAAPPHTFDGGPFGTLAITAVLSGMGLAQSNWDSGDSPTHWELANGQVFLQKTSGWWQFYLQAGAYNIPTLGIPFSSTVDTLTELFGPLPQAYVKLVKGNLSFMGGQAAYDDRSGIYVHL